MLKQRVSTCAGSLMESLHHFLDAALARLNQVKGLGEGVLAQTPEPALLARSDAQANSIAIIVQHLHGNMLSRWTDFLSSDGEKPWRRRDAEFEPAAQTAARVRELWDEGWACCLGAVSALAPADLLLKVSIRGEAMTAMDAIIRQISHYAYHVGQMVTLARTHAGPAWRSLSISRGRSTSYRPEPRRNPEC
jgi:hypothetical protein